MGVGVLFSHSFTMIRQEGLCGDFDEDCVGNWWCWFYWE